MTQAPIPAKKPFAKPWLACADQVQLLSSRGLVVGDVEAAKSFLAHINYYRFSGYCLAFEQARHMFIPQTTFEQVCRAHDFDRTLRDLLNEALEVIEVDLRATVAIQMGRTYGPFGHTQPKNFYGWFDVAKLRDEAERSSEPFVQHFKRTYAEFPDLPIWVVTETMSFGTLSILLKHMHKTDQIAVAGRYGLHHLVLKALAHHFVYVRNLCAHHARVWDRAWSIQPTLPRHPQWQPPLVPAGDRLFATLLLMSHILKQCPTAMSFRNEWRARVQALIDQPPACPQPLRRMGITGNWKQHPAWREP